VKQAPAWNKVTIDFKGNPDVAFGDVVLAKNQVRSIHGTEQGPGAGGWPTIRYFNKQTGYGGKPYTKKTSKAMCDELGPSEEYMQEYVEEQSGASLCSVDDAGKGCSDAQKQFLGKWSAKPAVDLKKQLDRLQGMVEKDGSSMKPEALKWAKQRLGIIKQFGKKVEL